MFGFYIHLLKFSSLTFPLRSEARQGSFSPEPGVGQRGRAEGKEGVERPSPPGEG